MWAFLLHKDVGRRGGLQLFSHSFRLLLGRELCSEDLGEKKTSLCFFRWMSLFLGPALADLLAHTWIKHFWVLGWWKHAWLLAAVQELRCVHLLLLGWGGKAAFQRTEPRNVSWRPLFSPTYWSLQPRHFSWYPCEQIYGKSFCEVFQPLTSVSTPTWGFTLCCPSFHFAFTNRNVCLFIFFKALLKVIHWIPSVAEGALATQWPLWSRSMGSVPPAPQGSL